MSMVYISVTRLRVCSARYLLPFITRVLSIGRQAQEAAGFLGGKLLYEIRLRPVNKGNVKQPFVPFVQAVLVGILLTACSSPSASGSSQINLPEPEDFAALEGVPATGQSSYQSTCAACHGPQARGIASLGKDLTDSEFIKDRSDAELIVFLTNGRRSSDPLNETGLEMPPKGGNPALTNQDLADIVAYIRTLSE